MTPLAIVHQSDSPSPAVRRYADGRNGAIRPLGLPTCPDCGQPMASTFIKSGGTYVPGHYCETPEPAA